MTERLRATGLVGGPLLLSFLFLLTLLVVSALVSYVNVETILRNGDTVQRTNEVLDMADQTDADLSGAESAARGFVNTGFDGLAVDYQARTNELKPDIHKLESLTSDNPRQQVRLASFQSLLQTRLRMLSDGIELKRNGITPPKDEAAMRRALQIHDELESLLADFRSEEDQLLSGRSKSIRERESVAEASFWSMTLLGVLALVGFYTMVSRLVKTELALRQVEAKRAAELEARVEQRTAELLAANRDLESFSYSVSHDLRAPLRAIGSFARVLQDDAKGGLSEENNETLDRIVEGCHKMAELIDALLNLSRLSRTELMVREVDLTGLASEVFREQSTAHPDPATRIRVEEGLWVEGDPSLLRVLLTNLATNAIKFSRGADTPSVRFGSTEIEGGKALFIEDNGVGFDSLHAGDLFEPFHRLHSAEEFPGTGVGLAICERIVRRHGGRIWAESRPGQGARFLFTLGSPVLKQSLDDAGSAALTGAVSPI